MATDRASLGRVKVGLPIMTTFETLVNMVDGKDWSDFRREPAVYYFERMFGNWIPSMIDGALDDSALETLDPLEVQILSALLLRDLFRHNAKLFRANEESAWVESLFAEIGNTMAIPAERLADDGKPYELDNPELADWANTLAAPFGMMGIKLFMCHSSIVTGAAEECG